jgi:hypothetical protein
VTECLQNEHQDSLPFPECNGNDFMHCDEFTIGKEVETQKARAEAACGDGQNRVGG